MDYETLFYADSILVVFVNLALAVGLSIAVVGLARRLSGRPVTWYALPFVIVMLLIALDIVPVIHLLPDLIDILVRPLYGYFGNTGTVVAVGLATAALTIIVLWPTMKSQATSKLAIWTAAMTLALGFIVIRGSLSSPVRRWEEISRPVFHLNFDQPHQCLEFLLGKRLVVIQDSPSRIYVSVADNQRLETEIERNHGGDQTVDILVDYRPLFLLPGLAPSPVYDIRHRPGHIANPK